MNRLWANQALRDDLDVVIQHFRKGLLEEGRSSTEVVPVGPEVQVP